jgi:trans-aconitate 2-methyltransferase
MASKYQWDVRDYSKSSSEQQKWARELIDKLNLSGDERVLDIGSGDGKVTAEIAMRVPHGAVVGIDSSREMINFALEKFPKALYPNLSFELMDAQKITFEDCFDMVFSNATLHWIIDHRPVLKGISRSLRSQGRALLQMGGRGNAQAVVEIIQDCIARKRWSSYFNGLPFPYGFYEPGEYRGWLREAGLEPNRVELIPKDMIHRGKEGLASWVRTTWLPYTQRVPPEMRNQFINEIVDRYVQRFPPDGNGLVHLKMMRLEVEARK